MSDPLDLAKRCEEAAGPDRGIDGAIDRLMNDRPFDREYNSRHDCIWSVDDDSGLCVASNGFARDSFCARTYTGSVDAALSLVPDDMRDEIEITTLYQIARVGINLNHGPDASPFYGENICNSIPLAICAAALKAIAIEARQGTDPKGLDGEAAKARAEGIAP